MNPGSSQLIESSSLCIQMLKPDLWGQEERSDIVAYQILISAFDGRQTQKGAEE